MSGVAYVYDTDINQWEQRCRQCGHITVPSDYGTGRRWCDHCRAVNATYTGFRLPPRPPGLADGDFWSTPQKEHLSTLVEAITNTCFYDVEYLDSRRRQHTAIWNRCLAWNLFYAAAGRDAVSTGAGYYDTMEVWLDMAQEAYGVTV